MRVESVSMDRILQKFINGSVTRHSLHNIVVYLEARRIPNPEEKLQLLPMLPVF